MNRFVAGVWKFWGWAKKKGWLRFFLRADLRLLQSYQQFFNPANIFSIF